MHDDQVELLNNRVTFRKKAKDAKDKAKAAEGKAKAYEERAVVAEAEVPDLKKRAADTDKKKLTTNLALSEMAKKKVAKELEKLKADLPKMLVDVEVKGVEKAGEE